MKRTPVAGAVALLLCGPLGTAAANAAQFTFTVPVEIKDLRTDLDAERAAGSGAAGGKKIGEIALACGASAQPGAHMARFPGAGSGGASGGFQALHVVPIPFTRSSKTLNGRTYEVANFKGDVKVVATVGGADAGQFVANARSYSCALFIDGRTAEDLNHTTFYDRTGAPTHLFEDASFKPSVDGTL